jgi:hypothetical protein
MAGPQVDALLIPENLRFPDNQVFDTPPGIGNIIRHASGAVGNIPGGFKNGYVQIRQGALSPAGGAHSGCITANDDKLHNSLLFSVNGFVIQKGSQFRGVLIIVLFCYIFKQLINPFCRIAHAGIDCKK